MAASYTIESMQASDVDEANEMRMQSWLETYPNDEADVTLEWVESQHVGSIYVLEQWHGTGIGGEFMQKIIEWFDNMKPIELEVVSYNERAKAFYRKWGFEEIPNSQRLHREKMPVIKMIRKGD